MSTTGKRDIKFGPLDATIIIFVALKLTGTVDWSWLVILLPLIVAVSIGFGAAVERIRLSR